MIIPISVTFFFVTQGGTLDTQGALWGKAGAEAVTKHFGEKFRSLFVAEDDATDVEG